VDSTPLPGSASGTVDIRAPYPGLALTTTNDYVELPAPNCSGWTFKNSNAQSRGSNSGTGGLSQGTAFIALELRLDQFPFDEGNYVNTFPFALYPIYLQFRDPSGAGYPNNWEQAIDIEGNEIKFGGTQGNDYKVTLDPNLDIDASGVMTEDITAVDFNGGNVNTFPTTTNISNNDCLESILQPLPTEGANSITTIARKVFAIGQSQQSLYNNPPAKYGHYRLIARYPWGLDSNNVGEGQDIVLGSGPLCPSNEEYKYYTEDGVISLTLTSGDFYYPANYGSENVFQYLVSSLNNQDATEATKLAAIKPVYAREWAYKYVSKFYTDIELTQPWTPPAGAGWYSYRAVDNNSISAKYGNDFSFPRALQSTIQGQQNINRKWAAYFNSDGLKSMGDAQPAVSPSDIGKPQ